MPLLLVVAVFFLKEGIHIESFRVGHYQFRGLYLKLDNRLTFRAEELSIPKSGTTEKYDEVDVLIRKIKKVLLFFEYIYLDQVKFVDNTYRVVYKDNTLYIDSDDYEVAATVTPQKGGVVAEVPLLYLKKQHLVLHGEFRYGYRGQRLTFEGRYELGAIKGKLAAELEHQKVTFLLDSEKTSDISSLLHRLSLSPVVAEWIGKRVLAKQYRLLSLRGEGKLTKQGFVPSVSSLQAKVKLEDVLIRFHPKRKRISAQSLEIRLHDNRLDFDLRKPDYLGKSLSGSKVALLGISGKEPLRLLLELAFNSRYDKDITDLLKAYDIVLPIVQKKGRMKAKITLDIALETGEDVKVEGRVFVSKGALLIGDVPLKTHGGEVTFTSRRVALWNMDFYDDWYHGVVNGYIHLGTQKGKFKVDLKNLTLGDGQGIALKMKNKKGLAVTMQYGKALQFDIPGYSLRINPLKNGTLKITDTNLKPLLRSVRGLPIPLAGGKVTLRLKKDNALSFDGEVQWKKSYLYQKGKPLSVISAKGSYAKGRMLLNALQGKVKYDSREKIVRLKNLNIDAKKMLDGKTKGGAGMLDHLKVRGKNSMIRYEKYVLLSDTFSLDANGKNIVFQAVKDGDSVRLEKNGNSIVVHANQIKDKMLAALIHFNGMRGGRYSLELLGTLGGAMHGVVTLKSGAIESFKAYNDLIALFNTIPALMTLSDPGFSKKGFVVRDGKIVFRITSDQVIFESIYLNGKSATIAGKGTVGIKNGRLDIDLAVRTAREIGKVLGSLPLVGYILFGKDKSMTAGVKITGTMEHPKAKTHPVQEALLYPLELIKRTITSPAHIINK